MKTREEIIAEENKNLTIDLNGDDSLPSTLDALGMSEEQSQEFDSIMLKTTEDLNGPEIHHCKSKGVKYLVTHLTKQEIAIAFFCLKRGSINPLEELMKHIGARVPEELGG